MYIRIVNSDKIIFQLFLFSTKHHDIKLRLRPIIKKMKVQPIWAWIKKLNLTCQIRKAVDRGESRAKLLKRLACTTWGSTQDVLCTAYKIYVRPAAEYDSEALIIITETNSKELNIPKSYPEIYY
ncbi:hypothetical protein CDAR_44411 [Caerostris darwini]|uniref:Uncharacterized protein n=1 Tax=Caerostris darwini TaxID=1538125 RepID=A0AAV4QKY8_9ARAC|nr:hypothetical protein CDAR_44411 [Caerostris darwini]